MSTSWTPGEGVTEPDPQTILHLYLDEALKLTCPGSPSLLFKVFYALPNYLNTDYISNNGSLLLSRHISSHFALRADSALDNASALFEKLTHVLPKVAKMSSMWPELDIDFSEND